MHLIVHIAIRNGGGIEQNLEIRSIFWARKLNSSFTSQVTTSRAPHDTHLVWIHLPVVGMLTHNLDCLLHITQRGLKMSVGHTIFQHSQRHAYVVEPRCQRSAFFFYLQIDISATRTSDDDSTIRSKCRVNPQLRLRNIVDTPWVWVPFLASKMVVVGCSIRPERNDHRFSPLR